MKRGAINGRIRQDRHSLFLLSDAKNNVNDIVESLLMALLWTEKSQLARYAIPLMLCLRHAVT